MRILIATGILEPESGGPAIYAPRLGEQLVQRGWNVTLLSYVDAKSKIKTAPYTFDLVRIPRSNKILNRIRFFLSALKLVRNADIVYTLDWFAAGLPLALACLLRRKQYIVRIGGDYIWEQKYLESGEQPMPLADFYEKGLYLGRRYMLMRRIIGFVISRAERVIFNSDEQQRLYIHYYGLAPNRTSVIYNPIPRAALSHVVRTHATKEFIFSGRLIVMKNIELLVRAFARARLPSGYTLTIIGDGPEKKHLLSIIKELRLEESVHIIPAMPHIKALTRIRNARAFILPSWTDISPNQVYEAIALGVPIIVTSENYLPIRNQLPLMADPRSVADFASKIELLADDDKYENISDRFRKIVSDRSWEAVAEEHEVLFAEHIKPSLRPASEVRVLQVSADRSRRGILYADSPTVARQRAYGARLRSLDCIAFSLKADAGHIFHPSDRVSIYPTNSLFRIFYGYDAVRIAFSVHRPDVISVQDPFETGLVGLLIAILFRVPLHVQVHTDPFTQGYARHSLFNRIRVYIAGQVLKRAARVRVVSKRTKIDIQDRLNVAAPISVLPIYVDVQRFTAQKQSEELILRFSHFKKKILVVSRLEAEKNVQLAISSFAEVAPADACLIIVGAGSQLAKLKTFASSSEAGARIFFEGEQDPATYFALADLVLVTSKYEGYGMTTIEALASGKPVLSTDVGIARDEGVIVANEESFASALKSWFADGPLEMHLRSYPYNSFDEYAKMYAEDIAACA